MSKTRGRPVKNTNTITINELTVEYLSTKEDNYKMILCILKLLIQHLEQR